MEPFLWVEQYRPKNVESCILPKDLKDTFNKFVEQGSLPNLILSGIDKIDKLSIPHKLKNQIKFKSQNIFK